MKVWVIEKLTGWSCFSSTWKSSLDGKRVPLTLFIVKAGCGFLENFEISDS